MRWQMGRRSGNIVDRRGGGGVVKGGGGLIALALVVWLLGGDPTMLLVQGVSQSLQTEKLSPEQAAEQKDFVAAVLGNTEDVWDALYRERGQNYRQPKLVLFTGYVDSGCGTAGASIGPFYCPLDQQVYIDLGFFHDLQYQLNAPGDFARAYVIAHEVGHHVQRLDGTSARVRAAQQRASASAGRALSVRLELQADCYSGVWAHHAQARFNMIEEGDIAEALNAASQIGDDRLQQQSQGRVVPDAFTHGSSQQRRQWFQRGFDSGKPEACDTFAIATP